MLYRHTNQLLEKSAVELNAGIVRITDTSRSVLTTNKLPFVLGGFRRSGREGSHSH